MNKFYIFLTVFMAVFTIKTVANEITGDKTSYTLLYQSTTKIVIEVKVGGFQLLEVQTPGGIEYKAIVDDGTPILQKGAPDLQKLTTSLIIPDDKSMQLSMTIQDYTTLTNINIAPSKGSIVRTIDPNTIPFSYSDLYSADIFFPSSTATLRTPHIIRDFRGQTIVINPLQYNPVTKELRIAKDLIIELTVSNEQAINPLVRPKPLAAINDQFDLIYHHHFLNYDANQLRYTPLQEGGRMLIISDASFMNAMQPFIDWKKQEGIQVDIKDVATVGTTSVQIKSFVQNYYDNHSDFAYLLLVGDAAQIPTKHSGSGWNTSDDEQDYSYLSGGTGDHYPDIFIGRFSAESVEQVNTQVDRTIQYEKNPTSGSWYKNGVGIGSNLGPGDDNEYDWQHQRNIRTQLLGYTYSSIAELYDGNHASGGVDGAGNPTPVDLSAEINNGVSVMNYTGHGDVTEIVTTSFFNSNVNALTNTRKLPFIWIVGCQTGNFVTNTCFAETWMRATDNNGAPTGSIVNLMSTINQLWDEPMEAQDEFNKVLTENAGTNVKRTFGGVSVAGLMKMNDSYGSTGADMTDTWACFGDPSVMLRTDVPGDLTVTHAPQIELDAQSFTVNCNVDGAMVGLYSKDEILGVGFIAGGISDIVITDGNLNSRNGDSMLVTVTAYNKTPYQKWVKIGAVEAPALSQVFPNPAGKNLSVNLNGLTWTNGTIRVYNEIGQLMMQGNLPADQLQLTLDISKFAAGFYEVQILLDEKIYNNKIVIN